MQIISGFAPGKVLHNADILTGAAAAASVHVGKGKRYFAYGDQDWYFKWGAAAVTAAATDVPIPANLGLTWTGDENSQYISAFNNSGVTMRWVVVEGVSS